MNVWLEDEGEETEERTNVMQRAPYQSVTSSVSPMAFPIEAREPARSASAEVVVLPPSGAHLRRGGTLVIGLVVGVLVGVGVMHVPTARAGKLAEPVGAMLLQATGAQPALDPTPALPVDAIDISPVVAPVAFPIEAAVADAMPRPKTAPSANATHPVHSKARSAARSPRPRATQAAPAVSAEDLDAKKAAAEADALEKAQLDAAL